MAISIDTVYQKVLALANKEQRGYITPQEFNLFADQAQKEIFEQYFYDVNQFGRIPGNSHVYSDMLDNLEDKMSYFKRPDQNVTTRLDEHGDIYFENNIVYRIGLVRVMDRAGKQSYIAEEIKMEDYYLYKDSPLTKPSKKRPMYWKQETNINSRGGDGIRIKVFPPPRVSEPRDVLVDGKVWISYIKHPTKPNWGYVVVNDKPLYNSNSSINFELHPAEESELVYRILAFAGIAIEKPQLTQVAATLEQVKVQQEKQ